jgi:hypothetical protein
MQALADLRRDRVVKLIAYACGYMVLAGVVAIAIPHPVVVIGALFTVFAVVAVVLYPLPALVLLLFLVPFHTAIVLALNSKAHLSTGALDYWKDVLIVALFVRAVASRVREQKTWRISRYFGDYFLLFYVLAYCVIAIASPAGPAVVRALARDVEGPLLLLSIVFLRPTRKQLRYCIVSLLAGATIIGAAAVYEKLGPHQRFLTWYGAVAPQRGSSFLVGAHGYRAGSFLDSPLLLAFFLAGVIPLSVAMTVVARSWWRIAALGAVAACGAGLIVTITRSGYIGGGLGLMFVLALALRNKSLRVALIGMVVVLAGTTAIYFVQQKNETFLRSGGNAAHRMALQRDLTLLEGKPLGFGLGTTDALATRFSVAGAPGATESTIMAKALEGGLPGLALYATAIFITLMRLRGVRLRALRRADELGIVLAAGAIGTMIAVVSAGIFLGVQELAVEVVLWGVPGLALAAAATAPFPRSAG